MAKAVIAADDCAAEDDADDCCCRWTDEDDPLEEGGGGERDATAARDLGQQKTARARMGWQQKQESEGVSGS